MFQRRYGYPLTEAQRRAQHLALYGRAELPPRGTRLRSLSANPTRIGQEPLPQYQQVALILSVLSIFVGLSNVIAAAWRRGEPRLGR